MNENLIPVDVDPGYSKDVLTGAIVNTDMNKLSEFKSRSRITRQIKSLQDEINTLKSELETIKIFLKIS